MNIWLLQTGELVKCIMKLYRNPDLYKQISEDAKIDIKIILQTILRVVKR